MYQKIVIIGRLGRDPESRFTPDGTQLTSFSVATDEKWKDANGAAQQRTTWFRVTAWKRQAEICLEYLRKGSLVMVEGMLTEPKPYQGRDGDWRASLDVRANVVRFLSRVEGESNSEAGPAPRDNGAVSDISDENVPF